MSTAITNPNRKHFWETQRCRPRRCINRDQQSRSISGAAVYHQFALKNRDQSQRMSVAAVSARVVYQPLSAKQKHIRRSGISPARYVTCDHGTESLSGADVYQQQSAQRTPIRQRPADICKIASTSFYEQRGAELKAGLDHTAAATRTACQRRSAQVYASTY